MRVAPSVIVLALVSCDEAGVGGGLDAAKTPDGSPPSVEDVCDDYEGSAYGLCTAYCEAMDCDHDPHHASDAACARVAEQFARKTGEEPPCEAPAGACVDAIDDLFEFQPAGFLDLPVLANDVIDPTVDAWIQEIAGAPEGADLAVSTDDPTRIVGTFYEGAGGFSFSFEYTACCESGCDTASVTVMGS